MNDSARATYALRMADDALITAQRLCEWSSRAPTLEEDLALANVGLDYLGRARMCYDYAGRMLDKTEDQLAYLRDAREFSNALLFELPRGDFAFTMVRQYLADEFELLFFAALRESVESEFAAIAEKTLKEVAYHQRRSYQWMLRLGLGTVDSRRRTQTALDELWGYVGELFEMDSMEADLVGNSVAVDKAALRAKWDQAVSSTLEESSLNTPDHGWQVTGGREGLHTEHLGHLLGEMQFLQRAYPGLAW